MGGKKGADDHCTRATDYERLRWGSFLSIFAPCPPLPPCVDRCPSLGAVSTAASTACDRARQAVRRGGVDPALGGRGDDELRATVDVLSSALAVLAMRVQAQGARLDELGVAAAHVDCVEEETIVLRSLVERVDARLDGLLAMLTEGGDDA